jgi:hypothetical protein
MLATGGGLVFTGKLTAELVALDTARPERTITNRKLQKRGYIDALRGRAVCAVTFLPKKAQTTLRLRAVVAVNILVVSLQEGKRWLGRNAVTFTNAQPNSSGL